MLSSCFWAILLCWRVEREIEKRDTEKNNKPEREREREDANLSEMNELSGSPQQAATLLYFYLPCFLSLWFLFFILFFFWGFFQGWNVLHTHFSLEPKDRRRRRVPCLFHVLPLCEVQGCAIFPASSTFQTSSWFYYYFFFPPTGKKIK